VPSPGRAGFARVSVGNDRSMHLEENHCGSGAL
jgi:hypothetical protein